MAAFLIIAFILFIDNSIITTSDIEDYQSSDGEFFISTFKLQREENYKILRDTYSTFSDEQVLLISKCSEEKLIEFVKTTEDYDVPLPYFESQEEMNNHFISIIKRKVMDSEITLEWYLGVADNECLDEVIDGIYK